MPFSSIIEFIKGHLSDLWLRLGEHIFLTGVSTGLAILIGVFLGILLSYKVWLRGSVLGILGILQTIPSLALLVLLLVVFKKIGSIPAIVALLLYALLPIVRNTLTGLERVPQSTQEAARGMGMTGFQKLFMVDLPLSLPTIVAGVRTAAVISVGIATLCALVGAGGLGQFINRGLSLTNTGLLLLGAIPAALLALLVDGVAGLFLWGLKKEEHTGILRAGTPLGRVLKVALLSSPLLLVVLGVMAFWFGNVEPMEGSRNSQIVRIGSKNFTEEIVLGELFAQLIEGHFPEEITVERRFGLGGTMIAHNALLNQEIDLYPEYTSTALMLILGKPMHSEPQTIYKEIVDGYQEFFPSLQWLKPYAFNNTYVLAVREEYQRQRRVKTISDLVPIAPQMRAGFDMEFADRPDGYPGLQNSYGIRFGAIKEFNPTLLYRALAEGALDVIVGYATDGRFNLYNLVFIEDDKAYFPSYYVAPVVNRALLEAVPELGSVLELPASLLDDEAMRSLNFLVDEKNLAPADVVNTFLVENNLLGKPN